MKKNKLYRNVLLVFVLTLVYSILRYNIFGNISPYQIPTLIANKAFAFSLIVILVLVMISALRNKSIDYLEYLSVFKIFLIAHVIISIILLSQSNYPKLFADDKLTGLGNAAIFCGVISFVYCINKKFKIRNFVLYSLISLHLSFIGFKGWFDIGKWNGMLPPITLICFLILLVLIILTILTGKGKYLKFNRTEMEKPK